MRVQDVVVGVPVGAIATKGVLADARAAGYRERRGMADGGARVPEVLSAAELEGFFAGFVTEPLEPAHGSLGLSSRKPRFQESRVCLYRLF